MHFVFGFSRSLSINSVDIANSTHICDARFDWHCFIHSHSFPTFGYYIGLERMMPTNEQDNIDLHLVIRLAFAESVRKNSSKEYVLDIAVYKAINNLFTWLTNHIQKVNNFLNIISDNLVSTIRTFIPNPESSNWFSSNVPVFSKVVNATNNSLLTYLKCQVGRIYK